MAKTSEWQVDWRKTSHEIECCSIVKTTLSCDQLANGVRVALGRTKAKTSARAILFELVSKMSKSAVFAYLVEASGYAPESKILLENFSTCLVYD